MLPSSISDAQIQQTLQQLTAAGTLPSPTANTLYFLYLPPNVPVTQSGSRSCQAFCGYHNATSTDVYYAVMPCPGCSGCSSNGRTAGGPASDSAPLRHWGACRAEYSILLQIRK